MEEYTYDGSDMFIDEEPEAPEETPEEDETPKEAAETTPEETQPEADQAQEQKADQPTSIRVKYKGEERELSPEDAVTYAQKGMNYDTVFKELQDAKAEAAELAPLIQELDYWAKQNGMERKEYVAFLRENRHTQMMQAEMSGIKSQYPELPDEVVKEMAELRCKGKEAETAKIEEEQAQAKRNAELAPWQKFIEIYGITDAAQIPPDVMSDIEAGASPIEAMQKYEIAELKRQIEEAKTAQKIQEKHEQNKEAVLPSAATQARSEPEDSFLAGMGF